MPHLYKNYLDPLYRPPTPVAGSHGGITQKRIFIDLSKHIARKGNSTYEILIPPLAPRVRVSLKKNVELPEYRLTRDQIIYSSPGSTNPTFPLGVRTVEPLPEGIVDRYAIQFNTMLHMTGCNDPNIIVQHPGSPVDRPDESFMETVYFPVWSVDYATNTIYFSPPYPGIYDNLNSYYPIITPKIRWSTYDENGSGNDPDAPSISTSYDPFAIPYPKPGVETEGVVILKPILGTMKVRNKKFTRTVDMVIKTGLYGHMATTKLSLNLFSPGWEDLTIPTGSDITVYNGDTATWKKVSEIDKFVPEMSSDLEKVYRLKYTDYTYLSWFRLNDPTRVQVGDFARLNVTALSANSDWQAYSSGTLGTTFFLCDMTQLFCPDCVLEAIIDTKLADIERVQCFNIVDQGTIQSPSPYGP